MKQEDSDENEHFPLIDATDHEIIMHRDVHFGGLFSIMEEYYRSGKKGVQPEFDLERILSLHELEKQYQQNLAPLFLSSAEIEKIADARKMYQQLRSIYEVKKEITPYPRLISDLILSEEEDPELEIKAIVAHQDKIVPALIDVLRNEQLYDSLFPGYGTVPNLVVKCLGLIGDKRAIISLFEAMGQGDFFADEQIIAALRMIGRPVRDFLLQVVKGKPINEDNEKAAIALTAFKDDDEVTSACFSLLHDKDVIKDVTLSTYLVFICAGLKDPKKREEFKVLAREQSYAPLQKDIFSVLQEWKNEEKK